MSHAIFAEAGFLCGLFCALTVATSAQAITFDFNSLDNGTSNHDIENYMDGVLESAGYDRGTLSDVSGAVGSDRYSADNHIVGPKSGWSVTSLTLGNTDHCANADSTCSPNSSRDTFHMNNTSYSDRITLSFSGAGLKLDSISFDLEIFRNGSCSSEWNCGRNKSNWPDFTLYINGNPVKIWDAVEPGDSGTYENSPDDKYGETAPQLLTERGVIDLGGIAVTSIEFRDWPAAIGIDNLTLVEAQTPPQGNTSSVPPPPRRCRCSSLGLAASASCAAAAPPDPRVTGIPIERPAFAGRFPVRGPWARRRRAVGDAFPGPHPCPRRAAAEKCRPGKERDE